jgi:hypothetical protein
MEVRVNVNPKGLMDQTKEEQSSYEIKKWMTNGIKIGSLNIQGLNYFKIYLLLQ